MDTAPLVSLPLPMATALLCAVLAGLVWRLDLGSRQANRFFAGFFGLAALTSFLVGLRFGYGFDQLIALQRTFPLFLAPLLYLGFASLAVESRKFFWRVVLHLGAPCVLMGLFLVLAADLRSLDLMISASYAFYAIVLYLLWYQGPDALTQAPINVVQGLSNWLLRSVGFLVFIFILDSAIALDFALNDGVNAARLISIGTVPLILLLIATLIALPMVFSRSHTAPRQLSEPDPEHANLLARLDDLMSDRKLYLDPDITVERLARRLSVPARSLSAAVNGTRGQNMSQYVNRLRLLHAVRLLVDTKNSVSSIATQSGFLARSNFYREFQRVYGQSPTEFRASGKRQPSSTVPAK